MKDIKILAFPIDADGCVYNPPYHEARGALLASLFHSNNPQLSEAEEAKIVIESIPLLIEDLIKKIVQAKPSKVIFMVGSNRQSKPQDVYTQEYFGTGPFMPALAAIKNKIENEFKANGSPIEFELDQSLLDDFVRKDLRDEARGHDPIWFDDTKCNIVYTQLHRVASRNPEANSIEYHFYDDHTSFFTHMSELYSNESYLLPKNTSLHMSKYGKKHGDEMFQPVSDLTPILIPFGKVEGTGSFNWICRSSIRRGRLAPGN